MSRWDSLIKKYEYMFELMSDKRYPIYYGITCDGGWKDIILKLIDDISKIDDNKEVRIFQIKEKFGSLRVYLERYPSPDTFIEKVLIFISKYYNKLIRNLNSILPLRLYKLYKFYIPKKKRKILDLIREAEKLSMLTCEICGSNHYASIKNIDGWLQCICAECEFPLPISEWNVFQDNLIDWWNTPDEGEKIEVSLPASISFSNRILLYYDGFEYREGSQWRYIR